MLFGPVEFFFFLRCVRRATTRPRRLQLREARGAPLQVGWMRQSASLRKRCKRPKSPMNDWKVLRF
jgi:hypothetical protein